MSILDSGLSSLQPPTLREFGDVAAMRQSIYDNVFDAASTLPDVTNKTHTLALKNVHWQDPDHFTKQRESEAQLKGETLGRRLRGVWELKDNATGNVLDRREQVLMKVPHLTSGGTFIHNGNEMSLTHQQRLRSGVYTHEKNNGQIENHVNVLEGGPSHRYWLDPTKGVFYTHIGQADIPLLPLLQHLGASEPELREAWGKDLYSRNVAKADGAATGKYVSKFLKGGIVPEGKTTSAALQEAFAKMKLDPTVNKRTLKQPFDHIDKNAILAATKKILAVSRKEEQPDDRDAMPFQTFLGPEDLFAERLRKDRAGVRRQLLFKSMLKGNLQSMPSSALQDQLESALLGSGLGRNLEEINALELLDKNTLVSRMGEGGIGSSDAVPASARSVQPSHFGFIDPLRTAENMKAGVDVYFSNNARKGSDGKVYAGFRDARTGQIAFKTPEEIADSVLTFPGALQQPGKRVPGMKNGKLTYVKKSEVSYELPYMEHAFSALNNLVPLKSMLKGQRASMASRMLTQALPLVNAEAPLVQNAVPGTYGSQSFDDLYGKNAGSIKAEQGGHVLAVTPDRLIVRHDDGSQKIHDLYNNKIFNRKTYWQQTPLVQVGERFQPGQVLAKSNYTDNAGAAALGVNTRVAYMPWAGRNFEDAQVISESLAKRLTSTHAYQHQLEVTDRTKVGRNTFVARFPTKYNKQMLSNLDANGLIKPGVAVHYGDPLILGVEEADDAKNKIHKRNATAFKDVSLLWEHHDPGIVTHVVDAKGGPLVVVKSNQPMRVGDKLSGRFGDKGVVAAILPDHQMPTDAAGKPYEAVLNPLGIISRTNVAQWAVAKLGMIAQKLGHPIKVEDFDPSIQDRTAWVRSMMLKHGIADTEDVFDPTTGNKIPDVFTGNRYLMKLHHSAESKVQGRGSGAYTQDDTPAKGGATGSKRVSVLDSNALLSHGATAVLHDAGAIRGQSNEDYWTQFLAGNTPRNPQVPMVYKKFINELKAAGVNVVQDGTQSHLMALTDKDIDRLAGDRVIEHGGTVNFDSDLTPEKGGLFDVALTGGHHGQKWSKLPLHEPMPNPVMEDPIRRVLGLTQRKFEDVLAGKEPLANGETGPLAIDKALKAIHVDKEIAVARAQIASGNKGERDAAVKKLGYLKSAKRLDIHPGEWTLKSAPVLPPQFRPVSVMAGANKTPLTADPNILYKDLIDANTNLAHMKARVGEDLPDERLAVYHALKAVVGLGDPISAAAQEKNVKGVLQTIFGSSPKHSVVQRKLISSTVDNVGRAVLTPNPDFDMDTVGLPESSAFSVYGKLIARNLKRSGMPFHEAAQHVKDKSPLARKILLEEMEHRPVIVNRAPVLHRFGIMALKPRLLAGDVLQMSPLIYKGFGADNDGDIVGFHVPISEEARLEALDRMLPSKQLVSPADFKRPVHVPSQEFTGGLFQSTSPQFTSVRPVRTFRNIKDVRAAWKAGDIGINDRVVVLEKSDKRN